MRRQRSVQKQAIAKAENAPPTHLTSRPFAAPVQTQETEERSPNVNTSETPLTEIPVLNPEGGRSPIQPKLTIGAPGDKYEQEADRMAQQVVQQLNASPSPPNQPPVQRQNEDDELHRKAESIQRSDNPEEEDELQLKPTLQRRDDLSSMAAPAEVESSIQSLRGSGQSIPTSIRTPLEQAFGGVDFSGVTVHTDNQSDQLNRSIQAKAFTTGQDIFFRQGTYEPGSRSGQELLAHELTHVVQQNGDRVQRKPLIPQISKGLSGSLSALQRAFDKDTPSSYDTDGGHGYGDHGPQTTEEQHKERLKTGKTPSGRSADIPSSSSKFASEAMMKKAIGNAVADSAKDSVYRGKKRSKKRITLAYNISGAGISYTLDPTNGDKVASTTVDWVVIVLEQTGANARDHQYDKIITMFPSATAPAQYDN